MSPTATYPFANLFGLLPGSVFVAPADAGLAREAFRLLRIRAGEPRSYEIDVHGVCPAGRGVQALVFCVTADARHKLRDARMIDPERIVAGGL